MIHIAIITRTRQISHSGLEKLGDDCYGNGNGYYIGSLTEPKLIKVFCQLYTQSWSNQNQNITERENHWTQRVPPIYSHISQGT